MAFDNVRLPEDIERDSVSSPRFQTTVTTLGRGAEQRNVDWAQQRCKFDISYGIQYEDDVKKVVDFFYARLGMARGFRFKDWSDYKGENELLGIGDGTKTAFQLVRNYVSLVTYVRKILCPVAGSVSVTVDGSPALFGINNDTGVITLTAPAANGKEVRASFEFDVPVRFNSDELKLNIAIFNASAIDSIELVELPTRD